MKVACELVTYNGLNKQDWLTGHCAGGLPPGAGGEVFD